MLNITIINSIIKSFEKSVKNNYPNNWDIMNPVEVTFEEGGITATINLKNMPFKAVGIEISESTSGTIIDLFWSKDNKNWYTHFKDETKIETMIRDAMIPWHMDIISQYAK